jgi:D-glycero-D-manno-heptose 1,7-bisphosphate phosphatase
MSLVILDRDGVINHDSDAYIKTPNEWKAIRGSLEAVARLNRSGYQVVIASNQSGIGRGLFDVATLQAIHEKMHRELARMNGRVDAVLYCPHRPEDHCRCRKPKPGMLFEIASRFSVPLRGVPMVGDAWRDIEAARSVEGRPILVLTGKGRDTLTKNRSSMRGVEVYDNLALAVGALLAPGEPR